MPLSGAAGCGIGFVAFTLAGGLALAAAVVASPARAAAVLLASDFFQTVPPSFFGVPKAYPNADAVILVKGRPIGPGTTDTIVQRQDNCILNLNPLTPAFPTTSCTIPIEWVGICGWRMRPRTPAAMRR